MDAFGTTHTALDDRYLSSESQSHADWNYLRYRLLRPVAVYLAGCRCLASLFAIMFIQVLSEERACTMTLAKSMMPIAVILEDSKYLHCLTEFKELAASKPSFKFHAILIIFECHFDNWHVS